MAQCPMYVWKYGETTLSTDRQDEIKEEKQRFKTGAMSVLLRLTKELRAAFESENMNESFNLAFRMQRYIISHLKFFLAWPQRKKFEDTIYNIVGDFYLGMKWLDSDMNEELQEQKIYCMLGTEMVDTKFITKVKASLMPHVLEKR